MQANATFPVSVPDADVRAAAGTDALEARVAALEAAVAAMQAPATEPAPEPEPVLEPAPVASTDGIIFRSRWEAGDPMDGGQWQQAYCSLNALRVVPDWGTGRGNGLEIRQGDGTLCGNVELRDRIPALTDHWGRFYVTVPDSHRSLHGICYAVTGAIEIVPCTFIGNGDGTFNFGFRFTRDENGADHPDPQRWGFVARGLPAGRYCFEWRVEYVTDHGGTLPAAVRVWPHLYNASGVLVASAATMRDTAWGADSRPTLAEYYNAGGLQGIIDPDRARRFALGQEGSGGLPAGYTGGSLLIQDCAIAVDGWVGER